MNMPNMLAYTIQSTLSTSPPSLIVGYGKNATYKKPDNPQDDSYWMVFLDAKNPRVKVKEFVVPAGVCRGFPRGRRAGFEQPLSQLGSASATRTCVENAHKREYSWNAIPDRFHDLFIKLAGPERTG